MYKRFQDMRDAVQRYTGQYEAAQAEQARQEKRLVELNAAGDDLQRAKDIITVVAQKTQENLQYQLSDIVSEALFAVFENEAPELHVEFMPRRGKTECDLLFDFGGNLEDPRAGTSGGGMDVASFALRIVSLILRRTETAKGNQLQPCLFLDEPFKNVSAGYIPAVVEMVVDLSKRLGIQLIITTHMPEIVAAADAVVELG